MRVGLHEWSVHGWSVHRWSVLRAVVILRGAAPFHFSPSCNHTCMRVTHCLQYPTRDTNVPRYVLYNSYEEKQRRDGSRSLHINARYLDTYGMVFGETLVG